MTPHSLKLKTGEDLTIRVLEPPLSGYDGKVDCWWADIRKELLGGLLRPWLLTPYLVGEIGGEVAGYMSYHTPADTRDVGLVEFVQTAEKHRQKGVASALLARLIECFRADGGLALYLCTANPHAGSLYEKHGFRYHIGDGMRYLAPDAQDFDGTYLAYDGAAHIRDATWGDLPRAAVLYNHPEPRWVIKDYLTRTFHQTRFESHFVKLLKRVEGQKGACVVLENAQKRVVGVAALERQDTFYEQHVATLSFRVCPGYFAQVPDLIDAASKRAGELSIGILQVHVADCDHDQKALVKAAGFSEEARLRNRLRDGQEGVDLLVYTMSLPGPIRPLRGKGDYYGGRKPWQEERAAASQAQP